MPDCQGLIDVVMSTKVMTMLVGISDACILQTWQWQPEGEGEGGCLLTRPAPTPWLGSAKNQMWKFWISGQTRSQKEPSQTGIGRQWLVRPPGKPAASCYHSHRAGFGRSGTHCWWKQGCWSPEQPRVGLLILLLFCFSPLWGCSSGRQRCWGRWWWRRGWWGRGGGSGGGWG